MKDDIVRKLREQLSTAVDSECQVVYVLCETRKLLEKYPPDPMPFALKLYCHWALHIDLTRTQTTMPFLERMDAWVFNSLHPEGHGTPADENELLRELVYLDAFRNQFRVFLLSYDLPTGVCDDDKRWFSFLAAYAGVIEDGSLTCAANGLRMINKVVFSKGRPLNSDGRLPFEINWTIFLKSGGMLKVELHPNWKLVGSIIHERTLTQ